MFFKNTPPQYNRGFRTNCKCEIISLFRNSVQTALKFHRSRKTWVVHTGKGVHQNQIEINDGTVFLLINW